MKPLCSECVFLVDDDEDDLFLVQLVFKQYSPECVLKSMRNGEELLQALATANVFPNLILLDLNMPFMGGFEALTLIRQKSKYDAIPIVILTTSDQVADQQRAIELKANGFITKPPSIEQLNQVVLQLKQDWLMGNCVFSGSDTAPVY